MDNNNKNQTHTMSISKEPQYIKVLNGELTQYEIFCIINYYNTNKDVCDEPIEELIRSGGGFKINIPEKANEKRDSNNKIKQLRWARRILRPHCCSFGAFPSFNEKETLLLFETMKHVLGEAVVELVDTYIV